MNKYLSGEIIDTKYRVDGLCSDAGGMGSILHVTSLAASPFRLVLKFCKDNNDELVKRFRREVRLLASYEGNSKIVKIVDYNLEHEPPYFAMKYHPDGDLLANIISIKNNLEVQEKIFLQMIDCIQELHSRNEFHRDIKPQNFLVDGEQIVVSDFGLTTEIGSDTGFTRSSVYWGTHGYIPPEFLNGGFKHADASGDVFMLGKTFYVLITNNNPLYLIGDIVPPPLFHIIERCCSIAKAQRYQTLAELKQSLVAAYDVLLNRAGGVGKAKQLLISINDKLTNQNKYSSADVKEFIEQWALLNDDDLIRIGFEMPVKIFSVIRQENFKDQMHSFLSSYEKLVESRDYAWSDAEIIATNMKVIFNGDTVINAMKAKALDIAIRAAIYTNRFAAMDTCKTMITSVSNESLGLDISGILLKFRDESFISRIEPSECKCVPIANALYQITPKKVNT